LKELLTPKRAARNAKGEDIIDNFINEIFGEDLKLEYIDQDHEESDKVSLRFSKHLLTRSSPFSKDHLFSFNITSRTKIEPRAW
jgi:hypothetical protein